MDFEHIMEDNDGGRTERGAFGEGATAPAETVFIETGRGASTEVRVGAPFGETVNRVADEVHYGGYFRVFLNGVELVDPTEAPAVIEKGMRIALTSYDKVG